MVLTVERTIERTIVSDGDKTLEIGTMQGPFDESYPALLKAGYTLHSAKQEANLERRLGSDHHFNRTGTYANNGFVYTPNEPGIVLIVNGKLNPILDNPKDATNAHREGKEFYVAQSILSPDRLRHLAKKDPRDAIKSGVLELARPKSGLFKSVNPNYFEVPSGRLAEDILLQFLLEDEVKPYEQLLKDARISKFVFI